MERKRKIRVIEKSIECLGDFSIENLDNIKGGDNTSDNKCQAGATLYCSPFKGHCYSVRVGNETYECTDDAKLKKSSAIMPIFEAINYIKYQIIYL